MHKKFQVSVMNMSGDMGTKQFSRKMDGWTEGQTDGLHVIWLYATHPFAVQVIRAKSQVSVMNRSGVTAGTNSEMDVWTDGRTVGLRISV